MLAYLNAESPRHFHHSHADTRRPATGPLPPPSPNSNKSSPTVVGLLCKEPHMVHAMWLCYGLFHADEESYLALFRTCLCRYVSHRWTRLCLSLRLLEILSVHCCHEDCRSHHNSCITIPSINLLPGLSSHRCSNTPTSLQQVSTPFELVEMGKVSTLSVHFRPFS